MRWAFLQFLLLAGAASELDDDLVWRNDPRQWHQQLARIVDHRFSTFDEFETFARNAKKAGVGGLMLANIQNTDACPGSWYNGLQLCDHINGSYPVRDGSLERWQSLLQELKPMRFMWWMNPTYWSVQGPVWAQAKAEKFSDVGQWFSWNVTDQDVCYGLNPDGGDGVLAQGSWGSDSMFTGIESAMASFGSDTYAQYLVDAMANSWTKNLGIDGYTIDCSANYDKPTSSSGKVGKACPNGMLQCGGEAQAVWGKNIVAKVKELQPQVVLSGEGYASWEQLINSNSDIGGQGFQEFHTDTQKAVISGDASNLEKTVSVTGADAASVLCYLHSHYDGVQPGACPTMYFRDTTPASALTDLTKHRMWVALEAGSGIVPQHDFDQDGTWNGSTNGAWYNVTNDPFDEEESPLWAFHKYRALNRLALRTKLTVSNTASEPGGALAYLKHDSMGPAGDAVIMVFNPGNAQEITVDLSMLPSRLFGATPYDLLTKDLTDTNTPPLSEMWTIQMGAGEMRFFSGFSLGVFAPRQGKKSKCVADDDYIKKANATTMQGCFLECLSDRKCENVFVEHVNITWMESPPPLACTLLGSVKNPAASCTEGTGTLIRQLPGARSCAHLWDRVGVSAPLAVGAPEVPLGPPSSKCDVLQEQPLAFV